VTIANGSRLRTAILARIFDGRGVKQVPVMLTF
jgi:hypothetical protein